MSVINEATYRKAFSCYRLSSSAIQLKAYSGLGVKLLGPVMLPVQYHKFC